MESDRVSGMRRASPQSKKLQRSGTLEDPNALAATRQKLLKCHLVASAKRDDNPLTFDTRTLIMVIHDRTLVDP